MKSTKAIFIDLDGTLYNEQKQISPATYKALLRAKTAGYEIIIATGRAFKYVETINESIGNICRYTISSTGGIIYDLHKKKIIQTIPIPQTSAEDLCKINYNHPELIWLVCCTDDLYSTQKEVANPKKGTYIQITENLSEFIKTKTIAMLIAASYNFDLIKSMKQEIAKVPDIYISNQHKSFSNPNHPQNGLAFYDISNKNVSKGNGVKTLIKLLGITKSECIAIGDDINDLSMFAECGIKVAMGNSVPEILKLADKITDTNNNDGVAKFLNTIL